MGFRDEEAALRARVDVLERELATLRDVAEERDRLKAQVEGLETQLGYDEARKRRIAEEHATARRLERDARMRRLGQWVSSSGLRKAAYVIAGTAAVAIGVYYVAGVACVPVRTDAPPSLGMIDLDATPEPALPVMSTSGTTSTPGDCRGYVPDAPQLVLRSSRTIALRLAPHAVAGDLVMMIVGSDGRVLCDDDGGGSLNPLLSAVLPPGDTRVWVGTYSSGASIEFSLAISARETGAIPDASGLAPTAAPTAGELSGPDARQTFAGIVQPVTAAGAIDGSCRGYLPIEPQLTVRLSREAAVRLHASGSADLVMLVRRSDGSVVCDDDSGPGADPQIATLLGPGEHRVWIGTYSESASGASFDLDASAYALDRDVRTEARAVTSDDLAIEGVTRAEISGTAIGARCGEGLIGAQPHVALSVDQARDVVFALATESAPYAIVEHPDRSFECVTTSRSRHIWAAGVHRVYVGVASESTPGAFTLTVRAEPSSVQPWSPR